MKKEIKKRNWTMILYADSCSKDWEEYLISTGVPFSYAYHDKDITEEGQPKKPHYHLLLCFDGPITLNNVNNYAKRIGVANDIVQPVGSVRGIVRYFCHKDNPEKYQYSDDVVQCRNGFDISDYFSITLTQQKNIKRNIIKYIQDNEIEEYADLIDTLMYENLDDMFDIASQNTFFFTQYIKSKRNIKNKKY